MECRPMRCVAVPSRCRPNQAAKSAEGGAPACRSCPRAAIACASDGGASSSSGQRCLLMGAAE
eukprot:7935134-Alexandrium_andersonii.AAC.1